MRSSGELLDGNITLIADLSLFFLTSECLCSVEGFHCGWKHFIFYSEYFTSSNRWVFFSSHRLYGLYSLNFSSIFDLWRFFFPNLIHLPMKHLHMSPCFLTPVLKLPAISLDSNKWLFFSAWYRFPYMCLILWWIHCLAL